MAGVYQISIISGDAILQQSRDVDSRALITNFSGSVYVESTDENTSYSTAISAISASSMTLQSEIMGLENAVIMGNRQAQSVPIPQTTLREYDGWQSINGTIQTFDLSSSQQPSQIAGWNLSFGFQSYLIENNAQASEIYAIPINDSLQSTMYFSASCLSAVESLQRPIIPPTPEPGSVAVQVRTRDVSRFQKTYGSVRNLPIRVRMFR